MLIDGDSLFKTALLAYNGRLDYEFLLQKLREESAPVDIHPVVFHGEPPKGGGSRFQSLLLKLGYTVVVVPPRVVTKRRADTRCVPVHLVSYLFPLLGRYTHFDFVSGDVDYSPVTSYLVSQGFRVRLWLFSDRIPRYHSDETVSHSIFMMNERYLLSPTPMGSGQDLARVQEEVPDGDCEQEAED